MPISGPFFLSLWFPKKIFDLSTGTFTTEHNITPNDRGWTAGRPIKTWKRPITPTDCDRLRLPPETKALRFARLVLCYFSFFFCFLFFSFFRARASSHFRLLFSWGEEGRGGGKYGSRDDDDDFLRHHFDGLGMVSGEWIVVQLIEMLLFSLKRSLFSGWITVILQSF